MLRVSLTVGLIGRMTVNGAYFICLQYSSEIFPTVIRGQGVGVFFYNNNKNTHSYSAVQIALCEIVGGIAIFLSPMVVYLAKFSPILPLLILGLCSLLGALATFFLPETAGQELPQTLKCVSIQFDLVEALENCVTSNISPTSQGRAGVWSGSWKVGLCLHQAERPKVCQAVLKTCHTADSASAATNFDLHRFSKTAERVELAEEMKEVILPRVLTNATLPRVLTNLSIAQVIQ